MLNRLIIVVMLCFPLSAFAADILDLDGNDRPLGTSNVVNILTVLNDGGHTVNTGTLAELPNNDILLFAEPNSPLGAAEITQVQNFVSGGGFLVVITDASCTGCANINDLLTGIGSAISVGGANASSAAPLPSVFFTTSPRDISGQSLDLTPGTQVVSGTALAGDFAAFEQIGSGLVVAFGDRLDYDGANPTDGSSINSQLLLNIADNAAGTVPQPPPAPPLSVPVNSAWNLALLMALVFGLGIVAVRRIL